MKDRYIQNLSSESIGMLRRIYRNSQSHPVRQRAHCIVLSAEGFSITQLIPIFAVTRKTIHNWFDAWERHRLVGLYDQPGRGRKPTFSDPQKQQIRDWAKAHPKNLKAVLAKIKATWGIEVSKTTVKRVLKSLSMGWRRLKRGLAGKPDPIEYETKRRQLEELKRLDEQGVLDLRYLDESGFCLVPYLPYAWQELGETLVLPSQRSRRFNVLGLMNRRNELAPYVFTQSITSEVVIACIDDFAKTCQQRTVIVMDQASVHTSAAIEDKLKEWDAQNIEIFWLPPYSPQLNLIEILWRFIKYEWIDFVAYESLGNLGQYLDKVLRGFGDKYVINFA